MGIVQRSTKQGPVNNPGALFCAAAIPGRPSGSPSSEPCTPATGGRLHRNGPSTGASGPANAHLFPCCPMRSRQESTLRKIGQLGRFFAVVEQLVERNLHRSRQFFERLDGRYRVAIFHARNITAEKSGALLDVTLVVFLFLEAGGYDLQLSWRVLLHEVSYCGKTKVSLSAYLTSSQRKIFDVT